MLFEIRDLTVKYAGALALIDMSLHLEDREIVTIIGSNGAGKSTTLRTISGLKKPVTGQIRFQGKKIQKMPAQKIVKMGIGHVPQGRNLFPYMSVLENINLGAYLRNNKFRIRHDFEKIFEIFPVLKARRKQQAGTLSGGEQQMLAIARALMGNPIVLLLDEPSIGLAPIIVHDISKRLLEINQSGTSILLVEQNAKLALRFAHRGYVLETGRLVLHGRCEETGEG